MMTLRKFAGVVRSLLTGDGRHRDLPARVARAITLQENRSEILIGWFQLAVVVVFGSLYAVSPKTFAPDMGIEPVPPVLAVYFVLTIIRLVWAHRWRIPDWALYISIVMDMVMLMGLIWSFHLQYGQPAAFFLKVPTLLYVFIFIALRALRFQARFVLATGIVAAIGWGILVWLVLQGEGGAEAVTRDYVAYMTGNRLLIGAEFDKIMSILVVTVVLAVALRRGSRLLTRAVTEETAARDLSRFFDPQVARSITGAHDQIAAGEGVVREAAILSVDVRGFTALSRRMDGDALMRLLAEYQARMVPLIQANGGVIDKFMGDGIMATFGAAESGETVAADALRAVDALDAAALDWSRERTEAGLEPLVINSAVATGEVVFGAVGDESRLEYTVIGDAVNLAAKLEKHNKDLGVRAMTTGVAYDLACGQGYNSPVSVRRLRVAVPGTHGEMDLVVLAE